MCLAKVNCGRGGGKMDIKTVFELEESLKVVETEMKEAESSSPETAQVDESEESWKGFDLKITPEAGSSRA
jgi:hypothetical protein